MKYFLSTKLLCLTFVLCAMITIPAQAINETSFAVGSVVGKPGEEVIIPVELSNNVGFMWARLIIEYDDSVLTLNNVVDTELIPDEMHATKLSSPYMLNWGKVITNKNYTDNGTLVNLHFEIAEDAKLGTYPIAFRSVTDGILDCNGQEVVCTFVNGQITVAEESFEQYVCNHEWGAWESLDRYSHTRTCDLCGESEYDDHRFGKGIITTPPTENSVGVKTYTCDICHGTRTGNTPVAIKRYSVTVNDSYAFISGAGKYKVGETVYVDPGVKSGYIFAGWTSSEVTLNNIDGRIGSISMPNHDVTITAIWTTEDESMPPPEVDDDKDDTEDSGDKAPYVPPTYPLIIEDTANGDVTVSDEEPAKGDEVTIYADPAKGYMVGEVTVTNKSGKKITVSNNGDGTYYFTQPASSVTVSVSFVKDASFADVTEADYFADAVKWAVANGITSGTSEATFSPHMTCTRAQAVSFLWRCAGSPEPKSTKMNFVDVPADAYYYDAVLWAVENGITSGTSATTFGSNDNCTRAQIVTFLWRAQKSPAARGTLPFTDVTEDAYYNTPVLWAVKNGITAGTSETTFGPHDNCSRAQIMTFLYRCMGDEKSLHASSSVDVSKKI